MTWLETLNVMSETVFLVNSILGKDGLLKLSFPMQMKKINVFSVGKKKPNFV